MQTVISAPRLQLFFLGFLTLFLELVLIRYLAGNIWNLGFFPNLVLLAVFLGMGTGFAFQRWFSDLRSEKILLASALGLLMVVVFATIGHPTMPGFNGWEANFGGEVFFTARKSNPWALGTLMFVFWFVMTWAVFLLISQRTAKVFAKFKPLTAYTLDISGSCAGILSFMLISYFEIHAGFWFLIVGVLYLATLERGFRRPGAILFISAISVFCCALAILQGSPSFSSAGKDLEALDVRWSPYQKLKYISTKHIKDDVWANGIPHQKMLDKQAISSLFYQIPYTKRSENPEVSQYKDVLVLGAGTGNDVTAALTNGAERVDAVEIDPVIMDFGKLYHPAKPYQDPRVHVTIDDGRAYMSQTQRKYDLIVFALTDSLIKVSPVGQLRLENYLFTQQSVKRAYDLLKPGGDVVFYNYYRQEWITQKIQYMLYKATGKFPNLLYRDADFVVMAVGEHNGSSTVGAVAPRDIATDDWPFLYLKEKAVPVPYLYAMGFVTLLIVTLLMILGAWYRRQPQQEGEAGFATKLAFLFMGIAFLLLESKSVIQFALLFGTTWLNNSLVFLGVLLLVLAANWCARTLSIRWAWTAFALLVLTSLLPLLVPLTQLLSIQNMALRFVCASLLTFLPIFFANLIFSLYFREQKVAEQVFGWNLLGAGLGGVMEYTSLAVGYSALAWLVAGCYIMVFALLQLRFGQASEPSLHGAHSPA